MKIVFENLEERRNFVSCEDTCKSGITRFAPAPILNHWRQIPKKQVEPHDKNYIIISGVNHSPEDWTGYNPYSRVDSLFEYLSPKYLEDLQNNNALLLLDQSLEGYHRTWLFDFFHEECKKYSIDPSNIIYTTGNMLVQEDYNKWLENNPQEHTLNVFPYAHFEKDMYNLAGELKLNSSVKDNIKYKRENKIKLYNCLNKRDRNHRAWFYTKLYQAKLLDDGLINMGNFSSGHCMDGISIDPETIRKVNETLPRWIAEPNNIHDDNFYIRRIQHELCLDSFLTVISEASFADENNTQFLSEKTFKAIVCRHPFIILGDKGSLAKLRELGYKTFDGFIDESYDNLPSHERMDAIIVALQKLTQEKDLVKWYKKLQPILNHNYNTLKNRSIRKNSTVKAIEELYNRKLGAKDV
jgi:hypothetical protein